jgi:Flp pilus assembly pilin Flp
MFDPQQLAFDAPIRGPQSLVQVSAAAVIFCPEDLVFPRDERAATAIEYGLIITGIAIATVAVLAVVGARIEAAPECVTHRAPLQRAAPPCYRCPSNPSRFGNRR